MAPADLPVVAPEYEPKPPRPEAWIGTRQDYEADRRFGEWIDMSLRTRDVFHAIKATIDKTPLALGRQWDVCGLRGFGGWIPREHDGLPVVMGIARGVAIHGQPFGALAARLGADATAVRLDKYPQSYLGEWPSMRDFVDTVTSESGWQEQLARLPNSMRPYIRLDVMKLMADAARDLTVIEHDAGVWVYDPRSW